jgi:hypothetical protein
LLHSCWCIAFVCWNSNSKFEFFCLSPFQNLQNPFPSPTHFSFSFLALQPASSSSWPWPSSALQPSIPRFAAQSSTPPCGPAGPANHRCQPAPPPPPRAADDRWPPPVIPYPACIPTGLEVESNPPPRAPAWWPWPARQGGPPGLYKSRHTPGPPHPSNSRRLCSHREPPEP